MGQRSVQAASERRFLVLGLSPLVLIVALMMVGPVLNLVYLSVHDLHWRGGVLHTEYVGLKHVKACATPRCLRRRRSCCRCCSA
jgi:ABC-type sugar transport system permease subunit